MSKSLAATFIVASLLTAHTANAETTGAQVDSETPIAIQHGNGDPSAPNFDLNITANPFYLLFGGAHAAASFRINQETAVGPVVSTLALFDTRTTTFGVQGQYHLKEKDVLGGGLILDNSLEWESLSTDIFGETYRENAILVTSSVNWQWFYDNGFNFRLGMGLAANVLLGDTLESGGVAGSTVLSASDNVIMHAFMNAKMAWAF